MSAITKTMEKIKISAFFLVNDATHLLSFLQQAAKQDLAFMENANEALHRDNCGKEALLK
jgi:hypothetical protein